MSRSIRLCGILGRHWKRSVVATFLSFGVPRNHSSVRAPPRGHTGAWANAPAVGLAVGMPDKAAVSLRQTPRVADFGEQAASQQQIDHHPGGQVTQTALRGVGRGQSLINHVEGHELSEFTKVAGRAYPTEFLLLADLGRHRSSRNSVACFSGLTTAPSPQLHGLGASAAPK